MSGSILSPENLCNQALDKIAYPKSIASLFEGSRASDIALRSYSQTRDDLLRKGDWPFARQTVLLTLLKTAPPGGYSFSQPWTTAFPAPGWVYEYAYPDCLEVRGVRPQPIVIPDQNPTYHRFVVSSDPTVSPSKVILCNVDSAQAIITATVLDPNLWETLFQSVLIDALAAEFQRALAPELEAEKMRIVEEARTNADAESRRG